MTSVLSKISQAVSLYVVSSTYWAVPVPIMNINNRLLGPDGIIMIE